MAKSYVIVGVLLVVALGFFYLGSNSNGGPTGPTGSVVDTGSDQSDTCKDECSTNKNFCYFDNVYFCGDNDGDGCNERQIIKTCRSNEECSDGRCVVKEYCGDDTCQSGEDCSSCSEDCGECYTEDQIEKCERDWHGGWDSRDQCYHAEAMDEDSYLICLQIEDETKKETCLLFVGTSTENTYVCEIMSGISSCTHSNSLNCKDSCYWEIAQKLESTFHCKDVKDDVGQGTCIWWIATKLNKPNLCSDIRKTDGGFDKNFCYYGTSIQNSNLNACSPITDAKQKDQCVMVIIRDLKLTDLSLCDRMTTDWKYSCQNEIETGDYLLT